MDNPNDNQHQVEIIGYVDSPFKTKFGLPRQPGLITSASASILMEPNYSDKDMFRGLDTFSHIWITFLFHESIQNGWKAMVRPPRLGGNDKVGVFSSRSPYRPNYIGQSVVTLNGITFGKQTKLDISCPDLVHNTPVIDIKPYIAYTDHVSGASSSFANTKPSKMLSVSFSKAADDDLNRSAQEYPELRRLVSETISQDPRPAYKGVNDKKSYAMTLYKFDVHFVVNGSVAIVERLELLH